MKKLLLLVLAVSQLLFHTSSLYAEEKISEVEFNETPLIDVNYPKDIKLVENFLKN